jgi:hypothetical protein
MKRILLISAICITTFCAAQVTEEKQIIEKGTWNITGNATLSLQNNDYNYNQQEYTSKSNSIYFLLAPSFGYAIKNDVVIGAGLQYSHQKNENLISGLDPDNLYTFRNQSVGITPYIRGYKGIGKQLSLYLQGEVSYSRLWSTIQQSGEAETSDQNGTNLFIGIRPGITYFLNKKLAIESTFGSLGYGYSEGKSDQNYSKDNSFRLALNPNDLFFGIAYYF